MIRALHLIERYPDHQSETGVAQLRGGRAGPIDFVARTVGYHGDNSNTAAAVLWMRRHPERFDLIHAWGERPLTIAALGSAARIVYSPVRFPNLRAVRWVRAVMSVRDVNVVCAADTMRRAFVTAGVPIERCHLIRPAIDSARVNTRKDARLRAALGFRDDEYVLLAVGESTRPASHEQAVWAASILHVLDARYRLLLWGRGSAAAKTFRFALKTGKEQIMRVASDRLHREVAFEELLGVADAGLVTARSPVPTLPIAMSMAAGLPLIGVVSRTVSELLEDRHTALMVGKHSPRLLAQRMLDLRADSSLQWSICDMARTEAYEFFTLSRFVSQWRAVYESVANGVRVEVPQQAPGAGLRFHGRA
jgi:glycosyltransferase involved in cell wall biosynthesis